MKTLTPDTVQALMLADEAITWAKFTSSLETNQMNHSKRPLDYIDLHPEPVYDDEPAEWAIWLGAAVTLVLFCTLVATLFALVGGS